MSGNTAGPSQPRPVPAPAPQSGQQQLPPFDYKPFDANGKINWPPFAKCVVCMDQRDVPDVQFYGNCNFIHLGCFHFICGTTCLQKLVEKGSPPTCPLCTWKFDAQEVVKLTYRPLEMAGAVPRTSGPKGVYICTSCIREEEGVAWCDTCAEVLCQRCKEEHHFKRATHHHTISEEVGTGRRSKDGKIIASTYLCGTHEKQVLNQLCEDCNVRLCNVCIKIDARHAEHTITPVDECLKALKTYIESTEQFLPALFSTAEETERLLTERVDMCHTEANRLKEKISTTFSSIVAALAVEDFELRQEITKIQAVEANNLQLKLTRVECVLIQLEHCKNIFVTFQHCTDDQTLLDLRHMLSRYEKLKEECDKLFERL